ncbi:hypothetical protein ABH930_005079 [Kitasatospora sp. GAS204A]|uniref:hypothetical protein n=1 Tax=unclassified Kitasatospora TaxID=2633591 RepID=UPI0024752B3F|nr:hypothetical protein [Kitasatospora sp. GAS204B]MDH6121057.1 hypothetical protein [Kitasatospora sp. GAS204B]
MSVFAKLARVTPLAPLLLVVSILSILTLGAPPDMARQRLRGARQLRRFAKRCGAYQEHVVERRTGAGVFGRDPCWETVTALRPGDVTEVTAEVARALQSAGYAWNAGFAGDSNRKWPGTPTRPALQVSLVPAGGALARIGHLAVPRRARLGLVLVWSHSGAPDVPGRADYGNGKRLRYRRLLPPVVPTGSTGVLMQFSECRPTG